MYLVLSTSLNPQSRSWVLAEDIRNRLEKAGREVELLDLRDFQLPLCDGGKCYEDPAVHRVAAAVKNADGIVLAAPIYNYDVGAAAKNVIELTGKAWTEKVVGFVCAAGGGVSYMSLMSVANSLMLDFRSLIIPRFVFATGKAFDENNQIVDEDIQERLQQLCARLVEVTEALRRLS
ncbi:MAG: NAD(P)H-dependent oxidoreductase [Planctomycetales bacterium]|nr:NAD(P)H-dependent oxidoreductase [Planctomycetales bacterium]